MKDTLEKSSIESLEKLFSEVPPGISMTLQAAASVLRSLASHAESEHECPISATMLRYIADKISFPMKLVQETPTQGNNKDLN